MNSDLKFTTPEKGMVSAILIRPAKATHLVVLGHGASSNTCTPMMDTIAEALASRNIATFRYNFPYSENTRGRDSEDVCTATIKSAIEIAKMAVPGLPILAGGHSFSARMTTTAASESTLADVKGIVLFAFPIRPAGAPDTKRAEHLAKVTVLMLFLSGTRDALADRDLLQPTIKKFDKRASLHVLDTADHSFKTLKRTRQTFGDVFDEMARITGGWFETIAGT